MSTFRNAAATSAVSAMTLTELGLSESWVFRRMVARGVFVAVGEGRWYMSEMAALEFRDARFVRMLMFIAICLILYLFTMICFR